MLPSQTRDAHCPEFAQHEPVGRPVSLATFLSETQLDERAGGGGGCRDSGGGGEGARGNDGGDSRGGEGDGGRGGGGDGEGEGA